MDNLEKIKNELVGLLNQAVSHGQFTAKDLTIPPQPEMGDWGVACFGLAKELKKNPAEIAANVAIYLNEKAPKSVIAKAESKGPYVNIFLNKGKITESILSEIVRAKGKYGSLNLGKGKQVMVEYSQANTHKEFHVGHLRNTLLGDELINLYRNAGYKVVAVNYPGDIGAHVAKCLWGYQKIKKEKFPLKADPPPAEKIKIKRIKNKGEYLGTIYAWASREIEEHPEYKDEVAQIQQKLEAGDKKLNTLWKKTRQWSLKEFKDIYKELGVKFDRYYFESEVEKPGKKLVQDLYKKGIVRESEGAIIMDLIPYDLGVFLLLKSDGTSLYATKDLALAQKKFKDYKKLGESIHVVDARQTQYFKQLFKTLELIGFKKPMKHLAYEFVTLPEGAMSSRKGNIVTFRELYEEVLEQTIKETAKRHKDWNQKKIKATAKKISLAAIKFDLLKHDAGKVVVFNIKEALSFDGFTGPYIEYTVARINSILRKAPRPARGKIDYSLLNSEREKSLVLALGEFPAIAEKAMTNFDMSLLPRYLYDLAKEFANFYHDIPVLKADAATRQARLALISSVKIVLEKGLEILGIEPLEEM
ncbi:MAG: arginine--tRNA ligase [Patescibacteria group bacterium]|nr:arginine--tRNA ligase [Patescibacteria group bacterium]MDD5490796.1 arginine--tRNA ligase [Patescibacteria group bacterium]